MSSPLQHRSRLGIPPDKPDGKGSHLSCGLDTDPPPPHHHSIFGSRENFSVSCNNWRRPHMRPRATIHTDQPISSPWPTPSSNTCFRLAGTPTHPCISGHKSVVCDSYYSCGVPVWLAVPRKGGEAVGRKLAHLFAMYCTKANCSPHALAMISQGQSGVERLEKQMLASYVLGPPDAPRCGQPRCGQILGPLLSTDLDT